MELTIEIWQVYGIAQGIIVMILDINAPRYSIYII